MSSLFREIQIRKPKVGIVSSKWDQLSCSEIWTENGFGSGLEINAKTMIFKNLQCTGCFVLKRMQIYNYSLKNSSSTPRSIN